MSCSSEWTLKNWAIKHVFRSISIWYMFWSFYETLKLHALRVAMQLLLITVQQCNKYWLRINQYSKTCEISTDSRLKVITKSRRYFGFSTVREFLSLVSWLDKNIEQTEKIVVGDFSWLFIEIEPCVLYTLLVGFKSFASGFKITYVNVYLFFLL